MGSFDENFIDGKFIVTQSFLSFEFANYIYLSLSRLVHCYRAKDHPELKELFLILQRNKVLIVKDSLEVKTFEASAVKAKR